MIRSRLCDCWRPTRDDAFACDEVNDFAIYWVKLITPDIQLPACPDL